MKSVIGTTMIIGMLAGGHAAAQTRDQNSRWCDAETSGANAIVPDVKIRGCTALIESVTETPKIVALALTFRGNAYLTKNDKEAAEKDYIRATKTDAALASPWAQLCSMHSWNGQRERAVEECSTAIKIAPKDPSGWTYRGDIYLQTGQYQKAVEDYDHAIGLNPKWMWPWDNRGEAYLLMGKPDRALQDFDQVIALAPDHAMGYVDRGRTRIKQGQWASAIVEFDKALKLEPKCSSCLFGRGVAKHHSGDKTGGSADIAAAKAISARVVESYSRFGIEEP